MLDALYLHDRARRPPQAHDAKPERNSNRIEQPPPRRHAAPRACKPAIQSIAQAAVLAGVRHAVRFKRGTRAAGWSCQYSKMIVFIAAARMTASELSPARPPE